MALQTILVTGAAGFLGSHLTDALLAVGASVVGEAGRGYIAGHVAKAGADTSGGGGLYPSEAGACWCCNGVVSSR